MESFELNPRKTTETIESSKKQVVEKFISESLPASEVRIAEPMNTNCEVSVVIPAYGERRYILTVLKSLAEQNGVSPSLYETIVIVNNPEVEPQRLNYEAIESNQETLKLINFINGADIEINLSEDELEKVNLIKQTGVKIFAIDKASQGKAMPAHKANAGGARNRGVAEAVERFFKNNKNGIIAQGDADNCFDENYIKNLIEVFKTRPNLIGVAGELDFERDELEQKKSQKVNMYEEIEYLYHKLYDFAYEQKQKTVGENSERVHFSGANMASKAFETAAVGGVPNQTGGEDTAFGMLLSEIGEIDKAETVKATTAYRYSPRTDARAGMGQEKLRFSYAVQSGEKIKIKSEENLKSIIELSYRLNRSIIEKRTSKEELKKALTVNDVQLLADENVEILSEKIKNIGNVTILMFNSETRDLYEEIIKKIDEMFPEKLLDEEVLKLIENFCKQEKNREKFDASFYHLANQENADIEEKNNKVYQLVKFLSKHNMLDVKDNKLFNELELNREGMGLSDEDIDFLKNNPEIIERTMEYIKNSKSPEIAMEEIKKGLNDELGLLKVEDDPVLKELISLRAIKVVKSVREIEEQNRNNRNEQGFININSVLSYGVGYDGWVHIHAKRGEDGFSRALVKDGLNKLANMLNEYPYIQGVRAISWIVAEYPDLINKMGFTVVGEVDQDFKKENFPGDERPVSFSYIKRDDLIKKYL